MNLTQGLHRPLQQTPRRVATSFRGRRRTFAEFGDRVARLAGALRQLGMQPGDRVGMLARNSDRYLEYFMGTWWGGGVPNPLNTRWSVGEMVYALDDCDTRILIVDDAFVGHVESIRAKARNAPVFIHAGEGAAPDGMLSFDALIDAAQPVDDAGRGGADLCCVMYTGGTTGFPKGVMQTHQGMWNACLQRMADSPVARDGTMLHCAPLFHMGALGRLVTQFIAGGSHAIVPAFEPVEVLRTVEHEKVSETMLVPTMIQALVEHPDFDRYDLGSLKRMLYGASPIAPTVLERVIAKLPHVEFAQGYGMTEASGICTNPHENHGEAARRSGLSRSVGRSGVGVTVRIVDVDGREVPRGTVGEIIVRAPSVMLGYWNKPEETAKALRDGWLWTGDGATMDEDGHVYIVDRLKDMIISGGENIYSAEVENVIARHPAVASCAVIGIPSAQWGESVHAVVVTRPGAMLGAEELRAHCREAIAAYKCPKTVEFRSELPLSAAGKILKKDLRAPHWAGSGRAVN